MKTLIAAVLLVILVVPDARAVNSPPSYRDAPVFFEVVREGFGDARNDELLLQGKIVLPPHGIASIRNFDWAHHRRRDESWWLRMERLDYLLSLIESGREDHRRFVSQWISRWYEQHKGIQKPNHGAWQGMVAGIRAMVLVRCLKHEEQLQDADEALVATLREAIMEHQRFLADEYSFESHSNHGMWNAMGLFETTRVYPDEGLTALALERFMRLTRDSVSREGVHREHSPSYHFYFMRWLSDDVRYLKTLRRWRWPPFREVVAHRDRMRAVAYYLFDHRGAIPGVGDSGGRVDESIARTSTPRGGHPWLFDPEAGFVVFKDDSTTGRRYVIFNIQNQENRTELLYHFHNDVSSVLYYDDGEIILGDQGRFSYSESEARDYFTSLAAHNTVFPAEYLSRPAELQFGSHARMGTEERHVTFSVETFRGQVTRSVKIPKKGKSFVVRDQILARSNFVALWNIGADVEQVERVPREAGARAEEFEWLLTTRRGRHFRLSVTISGNTYEGDVVEEVSGSRDPWLGWYAAGFERMEPSRVLCFNLRPRERLSMTTRVERVE